MDKDILEPEKKKKERKETDHSNVRAGQCMCAQVKVLPKLVFIHSVTWSGICRHYFVCADNDIYTHIYREKQFKTALFLEQKF